MRMLSIKFSAERLLSFVRRHIRLIKRVVNDESLIQQIQLEFSQLEVKQSIVSQKVHLREEAYDDLVLADSLSDDMVRNLFNACQQFDRGQAGSFVLKQIFPDEKFGEIIHLPFASQALEMDKLARRVVELGAGHSLAGYATEATTKSAQVKAALLANENAIREVKMAEADVEIAKEVLMRKYEANYVDARKKYGRNMVEKLFPRIDSKSLSAEEDNTADKQNTAA